MTKSAVAERMKAASERTKADKPAAVTPVHKPVRLTVDVDPNLWRRLMSWCQEVAFEVGRVKVQQVWVMRQVIEEALEDKDFQARVIARVRELHGKDE